MVNVPMRVPELVVTVRVEDAPTFPGTALDGEKLQDVLLGRLRQESEIDALKLAPREARLMTN